MSENLENLKIQYWGHSCVALTISETEILINPHFISQEERPLFEPDLIVISSASLENFHIESFKYLSSSINILAPKGLKTFLRKFVSNPIRELSPNEVLQLNEITVNALPYQTSNYRFFPLFKKASSSFLFQGKSHSVYYAGGSGYSYHFNKIGDLFEIEYAILNAGENLSQKIFKNRRLNYSELVQAFHDLKARYLIPLLQQGKEEDQKLQKKYSKITEQLGLEKKSHVIHLNLGESYPIEI